MTFGYFAIDCFLDPVYGIDYFVTPCFLHQFDCELEFGVDDPDEDKALFLQQWYRNEFDSFVAETGVLNGDSSRGLTGGESPRRIHHDHIELSLCYFQLFGYEIFEVEFGDICADRHGILSHVGFNL